MAAGSCVSRAPVSPASPASSARHCPCCFIGADQGGGGSFVSLRCSLVRSVQTFFSRSFEAEEDKPLSGGGEEGATHLSRARSNHLLLKRLELCRSINDQPATCWEDAGEQVDAGKERGSRVRPTNQRVNLRERAARAKHKARAGGR